MFMNDFLFQFTANVENIRIEINFNVQAFYLETINNQ